MTTIATTAPSTARPARRFTAARTGQVLSGLIALFLLFDAVGHILAPPVVAQAFQELGYPASASAVIGALELICLAVYLVPRTSVLGAILLTAYLGGAVSAHVRVGSPLLSTTLFPVYVAVVVWAGLYLRNAGLRRVLGFSPEPAA